MFDNVLHKSRAIIKRMLIHRGYLPFGVAVVPQIY